MSIIKTIWRKLITFFRGGPYVTLNEFWVEKENILSLKMAVDHQFQRMNIIEKQLFQEGRIALSKLTYQERNN